MYKLKKTYVTEPKIGIIALAYLAVGFPIGHADVSTTMMRFYF